jgi:monooxygenase
VHVATDVDVLIVGAGLSGIGAAYHLQTHCPKLSYAVLEGRDAIGGTWDLFRYPGIRSDSDMYTLGYSFRPWTNPKAIADGPSILAYVRDTAETYGITKHIVFRQRVERASWSSDDARWTVEARDSHTGEVTRRTCRFLFMCAGYYDYDAGYTPDLPGAETFRGRIVHPQKWTDDIEYAGKRVIVIGSGATAVTLVPALAEKAAHVTMLQRSPTYVVSRPARDRIADWLRARLPEHAAYGVTRWKNVLVSMAFYQYCRRFPAHAKKLLVRGAKRALGETFDTSTHFTPSYDPWDQRLCLVPDDDLFAALRTGRASVVTDHIETFTETGIRLRSGNELEADLVVTATGLRLKLMGGATFEVDGTPFDIADAVTYKGLMLSDLPNFAFAVGYTNASWTLKCDLASEYVCRLLRYMDERGFRSCIPRQRDPEMKHAPIIDFSSGYVRRALSILPKQGDRVPWKLYQNYALDLVLFRYARLADDAMEFVA